MHAVLAHTVMSTCRLALIAVSLDAVFTVPIAAQQRGGYRLESAVVLAGASPSWDYLAIDTARHRLFIARRQDGVTVYDLAAHKVLRQIAKSDGANATALVPDFDRGYTTNADGSTTIFSLSTLETIDRIRFGGDADAAVYEPRSGQLAFMMGDSRSIAFLDAKTGALAGTLAMPSGKLDGAAVDADGSIFVALRDRNSIARIDARRRRITGEWKTTGCEQPTGLAINRENHRLFVGCRGSNPVLAVMDSRTGHVVATHAIGRGNDGVVYDGIRRQVLTSNGVDANLVIYDQASPDRYTLAEVPTTRPYARTMAFDPRAGKIYLVAAEGTVDRTWSVNTAVAPFYPNAYFDDTFTLLTYSRR
jgi:DNA-binding beta-propeller fold protein YncE